MGHRNPKPGFPRGVLIVKRNYFPPQGRLAESLTFSAFLFFAIFAICGFTSYVYWDGIKFGMDVGQEQPNIIEKCKALEEVVPYISHSCNNCNAPIIKEQFNIPEDYYNTPRFFGLLSLTTNFGVALLMNGNRAVVDDVLLRNYKYGNVAIEAVFVPETVYEKWIDGNISTEQVVQSSMSSPIRYTGLNVYGPSFGENVEMENPNGYLFAVIIPSLPIRALPISMNLFYVLIRVTHDNDVTYLNDPSDNRSPYYYFRNEREKFIIYIEHNSYLQYSHLEKNFTDAKDASELRPYFNTLFAACLLIAISIQLLIFLIMLRRRRTPPL